ncbi:SGNH/GDSL hydrolase family protein [Sphingobium sufflavum]|uniref:SGNH/GDSL hydrolase family protein n=1 Tax=Sphingobium sufflavum TaxID=1129547 RepID=UPI001F350AE1|nr:SGNH/GDSL hydrolase family protein [Sphingobium sufflavum]
MGRKAAGALGMIGAMLALASCAGTPHRPSRAALPPGAHYVAMGSSFAAGSGIAPDKPGAAKRCGQSALNYATLLATRLGLRLEDRSCGGATTDHILGAWREIAPQIDGVTADTALVTLTIGGNDLFYVGNLFAAGCDPAKGWAPPGSAPRACPTLRLPTDADYGKLETSLRAIAAQVAARAPRARLIFVQYVTLVPDRDCPAAPLAPANAAAIRTIGERLAEVTARVARDSGAGLIPMDRLSRGHSPCDAEPWAVGARTGGTDGSPWHPNSAGMRVIADALAVEVAGGR